MYLSGNLYSSSFWVSIVIFPIHSLASVLFVLFSLFSYSIDFRSELCEFCWTSIHAEQASSFWALVQSITINYCLFCFHCVLSIKRIYYKNYDFKKIYNSQHYFLLDYYVSEKGQVIFTNFDSCVQQVFSIQHSSIHSYDQSIPIRKFKNLTDTDDQFQ